MGPLNKCRLFFGLRINKIPKVKFDKLEIILYRFVD